MREKIESFHSFLGMMDEMAEQPVSNNTQVQDTNTNGAAADGVKSTRSWD